MVWYMIEKAAIRVLKEGTIIGLFLNVFIVLFRIMVLSLVGKKVYSDERAAFRRVQRFVVSIR